MLASIPFSTLTLSTLIISSLMTLSRTNWLLVWASLELNILSFIPLLISSKSLQETEGAIKYFLAQALGSALILLSSILAWTPHPLLILNSLFLSLILKLGAAPCHFWFPQVISSISWFNCLLLATWQKLAPLLILTYITQATKPLILFIIIINALTGGLLGINQAQLRPLLAYSSITHISWIFAPIIYNAPHITLIYFLIYCILTTPIFLLFSSSHSLKSPKQFNKISFINLLLIIIIFLSLGGLPPLTGFFPKWILIKTLIINSQSTILIFLLIGSYINLYFYLTICFNAISTPTSPLIYPSKSNLILFSSALIGLIILIP